MTDPLRLRRGRVVGRVRREVGERRSGRVSDEGGSRVAEDGRRVLPLVVVVDRSVHVEVEVGVSGPGERHPLVPAGRDGSTVLRRRPVPIEVLAEEAGPVSGRLQLGRDRVVLPRAELARLGERLIAAERRCVAPDAGRMGVVAGEDARPAWATQRVHDVSALEVHALFLKITLDGRHREEAPHAHVVREDDQDVRLPGIRGGRALASDRAERRGEQPEDCNEPQERRAQPPRPRRRRVSRRAWSEGAQDPRRIPARSNLCRPEPDRPFSLSLAAHGGIGGIDHARVRVRTSVRGVVARRDRASSACRSRCCRRGHRFPARRTSSRSGPREGPRGRVRSESANAAMPSPVTISFRIGSRPVPSIPGPGHRRAEDPRHSPGPIDLRINRPGEATSGGPFGLVR